MTEASPQAGKQGKFRQYALAAVCGLMVVYFAGEWLVGSVIQGPVQAAREKQTALERKIEGREKKLAEARLYAPWLDVWRGQSLPTDRELARSLYQAWLIELIEDVGFGSHSVNSSEPAPRGGVYYALGFSVRTRGTVEQLTRFLFAFYETDLLHQVRSLTITPISQTSDLDLSISIEALSLARGATPADADDDAVFAVFQQQTLRKSTRLASASFEDYGVISERNLFAVGAEDDVADSTLLTSISIVDGEPQVWFTSQQTDELFKIRQGDSLQVGPLHLVLVEVLGSDVVLEADGERWLLGLGEKLTEAFALPPEY